MDARAELHIKRLKGALGAIPSLMAPGVNAFSSEFDTWQDRITQSLSEVFGTEGGYVRRFKYLQFWHARVSMGGGHNWSSDDQELYESDMNKARKILEDALEELEIPIERKSPPLSPSRTPEGPIVVNITNVLSQVMDVNIQVVFSQIDSMDLTPEEKNESKSLAKELSEETNGEQRWPVLAKLVERLRSIGSGLYREVAIPLMLEMLKKQAGL